MNQLLEFFNGLNKEQKIVVIGGTGLLFAFLIFVIVYTKTNNSATQYSEIIASSLSKSDVALVSQELQSANIPFSIDGRDDNLVLRTNPEFVNIAKMKLISSEVLGTKHNGWEIFEKNSLGTTKFENNIKYLQALEGELSKSIESLLAIESASVKIAFPKETLFISKKLPVTASAVIKLKEGMMLTAKQSGGIRNFIASAIPELQPENIKLINQNGELLEESEVDLENSRYNYQVKYKKRLEKRLEDNITSLVEPIVGYNKIVAKVTVDLDFTKKDIQEEIYDPEGTIRSQQTQELSEANSEQKNLANAEPGAAGNIQNQNQNSNKVTSNGKKDSESVTTNFEISKKIISHKDTSYASIKRVAVAVTFDSKVLEEVENRGEYILNIEEIVKNAVAFQDGRGDSVTVKSFKFIEADQNAINLGGANEQEWLYYLKEYSDFIKYLIVAILLYLFYRKFIATTQQSIPNIPTPEDGNTINNEDDSNHHADKFSIESQNSAKEKELKDKVYTQLKTITNLDVETKVKYETLIDEINHKIDDSPEEVANIITLLLDEG
jgi:flagellar M-ring protein FliF